jgi:hypothetical protein
MLIKLDIDPINVDADGICASQTPAAGGVQSLTIAGALTSGGAFHVNDTAGYSAGIAGVQIGVTSAGNDTGRTFTVTGTDENGNAVVEAITGASGGTAESATYWRTVTGITTDNNTAGAVTVGPVDEIITKTIALNHLSGNPVTVAVLGLSGTCQFDIDETFEDVANDGSTSSTNWIAAQSNKTADLAASLTLSATGVRLKFDSYSSGAELQFHVAHASIGG